MHHPDYLFTAFPPFACIPGRGTIHESSPPTRTSPHGAFLLFRGVNLYPNTPPLPSFSHSSSCWESVDNILHSDPPPLAQRVQGFWIGWHDCYELSNGLINGGISRLQVRNQSQHNIAYWTLPGTEGGAVDHGPKAEVLVILYAPFKTWVDDGGPSSFYNMFTG